MGYRTCDELHRFLELHTNSFIVGPQGTRQNRMFGDGIHRRAGVEHGHGNYGRGVGVDLSRDDRLERCHELATKDNSVDGLVRPAGMTASSRNGDMEGVSGCVDCARGQGAVTE